MAARVVLFIDYQNAYSGARALYHPYDALYFQGQFDPLRLGELLVERSPYERELAQVRVYRGRPDSAREPVGYGANTRQCVAWERSSPEKIRVTTKILRYPRNWPEERAAEKGIDVALALDVVTMAMKSEYDVGIVMSTDTDLKPALEAVCELGGNPYPRCEVAAWSSPHSRSRRLSIPRRQIWCHWLSEDDYRAVADQTDYTAER